MLNDEWLDELVTLVNEKLDSVHALVADRLGATDAEISEVQFRLLLAPTGTKWPTLLTASQDWPEWRAAAEQKYYAGLLAA